MCDRKESEWTSTCTYWLSRKIRQFDSMSRALKNIPWEASWNVISWEQYSQASWFCKGTVVFVAAGLVSFAIWPGNLTVWAVCMIFWHGADPETEKSIRSEVWRETWCRCIALSGWKDPLMGTLYDLATEFSSGENLLPKSTSISLTAVWEMASSFLGCMFINKMWLYKEI